MVAPIVSSKYRHLYQFCYIKDGNLLLLDDPGRVRSQITNVEDQIQRFDFILISTKYFYIPELVQMPVLTAHYGSHHTKPVSMGIF